MDDVITAAYEPLMSEEQQHRFARVAHSACSTSKVFTGREKLKILQKADEEASIR